MSSTLRVLFILFVNWMFAASHLGTLKAGERLVAPPDWFRGSEPSFTADSRRQLLCGEEGFYHGVESYESVNPEKGSAIDS